jgi:hypothetical protein
MRFVRSELGNLYKLQSKIKEIAGGLVVYNDSLSRQKNYIQQLFAIEMLPRAYDAALEEVSRRRKFMKKYLGISSDANDSVVKLMLEEKTKRKEFLDNHGRYLPKDLVPGLLEDLPQIQLIQAPPFDVKLPMIDAEDLPPTSRSVISSKGQF